MIPVVRVAQEDATHHVRLTLTLPDGTVRQLSPAGFHMIGALEMVAARLGQDLVITSAMDGEHSGPEDPHPNGRAFDVRTHDHADPKRVVELTRIYLGEAKFYAFLEDEGKPNEHMHVQLRHGIMYP